MNGTVLHFDAAEGGLIRGSDGQRYSFAAAEWRGDIAAAPGQNVDFEIHDGAARSVYPVPVQPEAPEPAPPLRIRPFFADRPGLPFAVTILIACLLPFVTLGLVAPNLFDLISFASMMGNFPLRWEGGLQTGLYLFYLLYLIPLLAILVAVQELRRSAGMGLRTSVGLFALVGPFAIVIGASKLISSAMAPGARELDLVSHISLGWILIAAAGLGLVALGLGWSPFGEGNDPQDDV
jgi:hypothetical protein